MWGAAISWRSTKQSIVATSSNHAEIIAIHEASRECVWLRSMIHLIREKCGLKCDKVPTTLYEDNAACIAQLKGGFIKGDRTKYISPKLFYTHELQKNGDINVQQIRSSDNVADLFTKLYQLQLSRRWCTSLEYEDSSLWINVLIRGSEYALYSFSLTRFCPTGFSL